MNDGGGSRQADHQLLFPFVGESALVETKRSSNRKIGRVASRDARVHLPVVSQKRFEPRTGVPSSRADCPDTSKGHCDRIRCKFHLHRIDSEDRAGRPGLSSVPRDERGLTTSIDGDLGEERAGTTVIPRWLELERYCTVWLERDDAGVLVAVNAVREGEWDQFVGALHPGERVDAVNDNGDVVARADIRGECVVLDADVQEFMLKLVRKRGVESCALDVIKRHGKMSNQTIGDAIGRHRTLVAREIKEAVVKACDTAESMGVDREDFVRALMGMGE